MSRRSRSAFTLIELLIVVAIISILMGLLIPAVQKVREAAYRSVCMNHMHQASLGLLNYEYTHGQLPAATRTDKGNWRHELLPFIEQKPAFDAMDSDKPWYVGDNLNKVATARIPIFLCPSSPPAPAEMRTAYVNGVAKAEATAVLQPADSESILGIDPKEYLQVMNKKESDPTVLARWTRGAMVAQKPTRLIDLTDGASTTLLFIECAGRAVRLTAPQVNTFQMGAGIPREQLTAGACWADPAGPFVLSIKKPNLPVDQDGDVILDNQWYGPQNNRPYSYHSGGIQAAFLDGSVRFISQGAERPVIFAMVTASGNDLVSDNN